MQRIAITQTRVIGPIFASASVCVSYLVWSQHPLLGVVDPRWLLYSGTAMAVVGWFLGYLPGYRLQRGLDLVLVGCLFFWLGYWQDTYTLDKPVYQTYPLYFLLVCAITNYLLIMEGRQHDRGLDLIHLLRRVYQKVWFLTDVLMFLVIISVFLPGHYLLYPIMVSLLAIHALLLALLQRQPVIVLGAAIGHRLDPLHWRLIRPLANRYGPTLSVAVKGNHLLHHPLCGNIVHTLELPSEDWKSWLHEQLPHCFVVLLDFRRPMPYRDWTLSKLQSSLARDRICVISGTDMHTEQTSLSREVFQLTLENPDDLPHCRDQLMRWLELKTESAG